MLGIGRTTACTRADICGRLRITGDSGTPGGASGRSGIEIYVPGTAGGHIRSFDHNLGSWRTLCYESLRHEFSISSTNTISILSTGIRSYVCGTAANPSYSYIDDTSTGMFRVSAGVLGFSTGGTNRACISSAGVCATHLCTGGNVQSGGDICNSGNICAIGLIRASSHICAGSNMRAVGDIVSVGRLCSIGQGFITSGIYATSTTSPTFPTPPSGGVICADSVITGNVICGRTAVCTDRIWASCGTGNPVIIGENTFSNANGIAGVVGCGGTTGVGLLSVNCVNSFGSANYCVRAGVAGAAGTTANSLAGFFCGRVCICDGDLGVSGDVIAFSTSDCRFKENRTILSCPTCRIAQIGGYEFDWAKSEHHGYEGHDVGVIAQEVEKILPEVVTTRKDGYKAVKYDKMVPLLIEGIKEQQRTIEKLEKRVENLEQCICTR